MQIQQENICKDDDETSFQTLHKKPSGRINKLSSSLKTSLKSHHIQREIISAKTVK